MDTIEKSIATSLRDFLAAHPRLSREEETLLMVKFRDIWDLGLEHREEIEETTQALEAGHITGDDAVEAEARLKELAKLLKPIDRKRKKLLPKAEMYRNRLINHNLRLVIKVANAYVGKGLPLEDLIQEGVLGFVRGIEKFDPHMDIKLGTYSTWWIRQKITRSLSNQIRIIRLPVHITALVSKVLKLIREKDWDVDEKYIPNFQEELDLTKREVLNIFGHILSFSPANQVAKFNPSQSGLLGDPEQDQDIFKAIVDSSHCDSTCLDSLLYEQAVLGDLNHSLGKLKRHHQKVLSKRYGWQGNRPHTYKEVKEISRKPVNKRKKAGKQILNEVVFDFFDRNLPKL